MTRMTAESEKLHGGMYLVREPNTERQMTSDSTGTAPNVTRDLLLDELTVMEAEIATIRAVLTSEPTARALDDVTARLHRIHAIAGNGERWARALAKRAHVRETGGK